MSRVREVFHTEKVSVVAQLTEWSLMTIDVVVKTLNTLG